MTTPQDPFATPPEGTPSNQPASSGAPAWGADQPAGQPNGTKNGVGVAALVVGLLALLTSWLVFGGVIGIVAIVLGIVGLGRVKRREASNKGMPIAGIVLGAVSILIAGAVLALSAAIFGEVEDLATCLEEAGGDAAAEAECERQFEDELTQ